MPTAPDPIGVPLASGFTYRPRTAEDDLDDEAKARVLEKWAEFDRSQRLAREAMAKDTTRY